VSIAVLTRFVLRHKLLIALAWLAITVAGLVAAGPATNALSQRFDLPGRESTEVNGEILARFGSGGFAPPYVVSINLPEGTTVDSPGVRDEIGDLFNRVAEAAPETRSVSWASTGDPAFVSDDGRTTFGLIYPRYAGNGPSPDEAAVEQALAGASVGGGEVRISGLSDSEANSEEGGTGVLIETLVGAGGALLVLLWVFGSFLAILPVIIAGISILTCFLLIYGLASLTDVSFLIQFLVALIGLGVAIDYSLLIVTRWREERAAGRDNTAAVQRAMETAGHAVLFSGTTVAISLLALVALPVPFLRSIGIGGLLIPLVSVAVTLTLLPVILGSIGPRLDWPRIRSGDQTSRLWARWARLIVRHRVVALVAGSAIVGLLLIPAFQLKLASPASSAFAGDDDVRIALEDAGMAAGIMTPFEVLVDGRSAEAVAANLAQVDGVAATIAPIGNGWQSDGSSILLVLPEADGSSPAGRTTLEAVRDAAREHSDVRVGGAFAADADFIDAVYGNIFLILAVVLAVTFILLVRAFHSIVLPLKAVLLNCITVAAAYGVLVLVWQHGYGSEQIWGIEATGAIPSWLPLMVFSFLFGLSMDYEVFILARMREEYDNTGSTDEAVVRGMSHTARLVTTAAIILFLAFVSMAAVPATDVKMLATALAAGILLDATIVRAVLVPAAVALMGHLNWWMPSWLDRLVHPRQQASVKPAKSSRQSHS